MQLSPLVLGQQCSRALRCVCVCQLVGAASLSPTLGLHICCLLVVAASAAVEGLLEGATALSLVDSLETESPSLLDSLQEESPSLLDSPEKESQGEQPSAERALITGSCRPS